MILRKPYAFLIKNFKLLHTIMFFLMGFVLLKTLDILSAFDDFFTSQAVLLSGDIPELVYPFSLFMSSILIIIVSGILLWTMVVKDKPYKLYIVNIAIYFITIILFVFGKTTFVSMVTNVVDVRMIKLVRDLITIGFIAQMYPLVKCLVRAVGFDIKQFDFGKDLAELEIEEKDSEEVEVQVNVDTNRMKRGLNLYKRNIKYFYKEHKFWFRVGVVGIVLIIGTFTTLGIINRNKTHSFNTYFTVDGMSIKISNAYVTRNSYKGTTLNNLNDNSSLVVIPIELKNNSAINRFLETAKVELTVGNHKYRNTILYKDGVSDIGNVYNKDVLSPGTSQKALLTFIVPTKYVNNKLKLKFITSIDFKNTELIPEYITFKINPIDLDKVSNLETINSGEDIVFNKSLAGDSTLNISNIQIDGRFKINYTYTVNSEKISAYEYVNSPLETNSDRVLMKITGTTNMVSDTNLNSLYDLINSYGVVKYTVGDKVKTVSSLPKVNPGVTKSDKTIYIAINSEIVDADKISLILTIRNKQYEYVIK
mgnify:CR=1 FL=1